MDRPEKLLLLQTILKDVRGSWGNYQGRIRRAMELAQELDLPLFVQNIEQYYKNIEEYGDPDGRHFRSSYTNGGYENMEDLHGLKNIYLERTDAFKEEVKNLLEYPEYAFDDYPEK